MLYNCSHNRCLLKILKILNHTIDNLSVTSLSDESRVKDTIIEHQEIGNSIKKRDLEMA